MSKIFTSIKPSNCNRLSALEKYSQDSKLIKPQAIDRILAHRKIVDRNNEKVVLSKLMENEKIILSKLKENEKIILSQPKEADKNKITEITQSTFRNKDSN